MEDRHGSWGASLEMQASSGPRAATRSSSLEKKYPGRSGSSALAQDPVTIIEGTHPIGGLPGPETIIEPLSSHEEDNNLQGQLVKLYGKTVQEINDHNQSLMLMVIGFASIATAVLAVTPTSWALKDYDDMCCMKLDLQGRCCFGVPEDRRAACCNDTVKRGLYEAQWPPDGSQKNSTLCRVAQSAVLFRRTGRAVFLCIAIATALVGFYVASKIAPAVTAKERRRLIELCVFEHSNRQFHFLWRKFKYQLSNVYIRFILDAVGMIILLSMVALSVAICVCIEDYFKMSKFCDMRRGSLTWEDTYKSAPIGLAALAVYLTWAALSIRRLWNLEKKKYPFLLDQECLKGQAASQLAASAHAPAGHRAKFKEKVAKLWKPVHDRWYGCTHFEMGRAASFAQDQLGPYGHVNERS